MKLSPNTMFKLTKYFSRSKKPASSIKSPLLIPELLLLIFAYLNPFIIHNCVPLVCRQWYQVSRSFVPVVWDEFPPKHKFKVQDYWPKCLQRSRSLIIRSHGYIPGVTYISDRAWRTLMDRLHALSSEGQLSIMDLVLQRPLAVKTQLFPMLAYVGTALTSLRIESMRCSGDIPLNRILIMCSRLVTLHLTVEDKASIEQVQPVLHGPLRLRYLVLGELVIKESSLLELLNACPDLEELRFIRLEAWRNISEVTITPLFKVSFLEFMERLSVLCPNLTSAHLSSGYGSGWSSIQEAGRIVQTLELFPKINEWSFDCPDATLFKALMDCTQDTLTSLEIWNIMGPRHVCGLLLHRYLCKTPHLLDLKASVVKFSVRWFDLEGILGTDDDQFDERDGRNHNPTVPLRRRIWACRSLRTLHFTCGPSRRHDNVAQNSRILFDYLTRVCPRLRDLKIRSTDNSLTLTLEGGFCLLSRLCDLRRLEITGHKERLRWKWHMAWMVKRMTVSQRLRTKILLARRRGLMEKGSTEKLGSGGFDLQQQMISSNSDVHGRSESNGNGIDQEEDPGLDYIVDGVDMKNLGRWKNVTDLLQDRMSKDWCCWPQLECLSSI
ncbi:hypothetical protein BC939DRAFT_434093 [Gamsiella multidivaricata]|uniref:uncharacterized protein n=1 Tax=Gamsiella multidivaricata TaxID=101098 RepID=UPI00221E3E3E|nr:uncharacterized protein BC939DRAFT_434093 [Gamsiella multidivaricata]KAI7832697.1 hypothetical protein BC939DRAFT_434093 [Gamsiella multidivaricata]